MEKKIQFKKGENTMSKRKIFLVALSVCVIAILSLSTLAWFTDEDQVTNKFYVGDTTTDADKVFGIDLWETADQDEDGTITDAETYGKDTKDDTGITYVDILPGGLYDKNPYFTNTGIHGQYLRAIVTVTEADILRDAMTPKGADVSEWWDVEKFLPGTNDKWELAYKYHTNKDTFVFVYYYTEVLEAGKTTDALFDAVVMPTELTKEQAAEIDNFEIKIVGQVIQSENLVGVANAKEVFAKYWDEEGVVAGVNLNGDLAKDPVAISYPVSGNLGTVESGFLVEYDPANYQDQEMAGVLHFSGAEVDVKAGASLVSISADGEMNPTIVLENVDITIEDGGYILSTENGSSGSVVFYGVTINGEKIDTYDELDEVLNKYFNNYNGSVQI